MENLICPHCKSEIARWWVVKKKYGLRAGYCTTCRKTVQLGKASEGSDAGPGPAAKELTAEQLAKRAGKTHGKTAIKRKRQAAPAPDSNRRQPERRSVPARRAVQQPAGSGLVAGIRRFFDL